MTQVISITILIFTFLAACYFIFKEIKEVAFLRTILNQIINKPHIKSVDDLIKIKNYLQKNINYNPELKNKKRPLLRDTATKILKSKYGFCGENARVTIKLMLIGGMKANRIYLFRKEWQHVLIEHKFEDKWYIFDGHFDEFTLFKDSDVAKIISENISDFPDTYLNNPYLDFCRIKIIYKISKAFSKARLPSFIVYLFESPYLIKSALLLSICSLGLFLLKSAI